MSYHSIYGNLVGYSNGQLLVNGRPTGPFPASLGGSTFYVNSAVDGTDGRSPQTAFGTLDEAFAKCTANKGDVIVVMPNHAETVTGAGGITHDVAGVSVIGVGNYNQRPRFLMDAGTAVTYLISAADAYVSGLEFASGHSGVVTCFDVTAVGATIHDCKFRNNTTNENFLTCVTASGATLTGNGLKVTGCDRYTTDTDDAAFITIVDDLQDLVVSGNYVVTSSATAAQMVSVAAGQLITNARISWNYLKNAMTAGELFFSNDGSTNTGIAHNNYCQHLDTTTTHDLGLESSGLALFDNYSSSSIALSGYILPAIDVNN
jgi:hypothetical protein